ncbi:hypothetical protein EG329_003214 [Mollisiaceae sp. DMI_Dod_QoI]|nr:hypothetical protein EG329_003214 [Helotiales sp. DMI_Dod_QoI]
MHSTTAFSALALALSSNVFASPLPHQARQDPLTLADTVLFIAKTIGPNPNPSALPNINNWLFRPIHSGAGLNQATLVSPSTAPFNLSLPGYFRNGTDVPHGDGAYMTAGFSSSTPTTPWSLVLSVSHQANSSNPGAQTGMVQFNVGLGTDGLDVPEGKLVTSNYVSDEFWACPDVEVEGGLAIAVEVSNRYANALEGCWGIELWAQCAGEIEEGNREAFPAFVQSRCYVDAASAQ